MRSFTLVFLALLSYGAAADDGARWYRDCAACHGKDGGGVADGSVPAIGGQPASIVQRQLENFRRGVRQDLRMQHFSDDEHLGGAAAVEAVSRYIEGLRRLTPATRGSGRDLPAAAAEFARRCASCHGSSGGAVAPLGIPALAGQHATYLDRKMREGAAGQNAIGRSHAGLLSTLSDDRRSSIADWLSRQPSP